MTDFQGQLHPALDEPGFSVNGEFDAATTTAIKRFQAQAGLEPDGIVGVETRAALDSVSGGAQGPGDSKHATEVFGAGQDLFQAGDFDGALARFKEVYGDQVARHKSVFLVPYYMAACHHSLRQFGEAVSLYLEAMSLPTMSMEARGKAMENLRRARLEEGFLTDADIEKERGAGSGDRPELRAGDTGPAVRQLQDQMRPTLDEARFKVNGEFDAETLAAVKRFQSQVGLQPDGVVGKDTWGALDAVNGGATVSDKDVQWVVDVYADAEKLLAAGDFATALDRYTSLYRGQVSRHKAIFGFPYGMAACHHSMGHFSEAVSLYEEAMALPNMGTVARGMAMENLRRARLGEGRLTPEQMDKERGAGTGDHPVLHPGDSGASVSRMQTLLDYAVAEGNFKVTGEFDGATAHALKRFQTQARLAADGVVGPDTWAALDALKGGEGDTQAATQRMSGLFIEGRRLFDAGDYAAALSRFTDVYRDPAARYKVAFLVPYYLGACHHAMGDFAAAISLYQEAMALPDTIVEDQGRAMENLRRARLGEGFQASDDMQKERAAH